MKTSKIIIYDEPTVPEIQIEKLKKFLKDTLHTEVEVRRNFFEDANEKLFQEISATRIFELKKPFSKHIPTESEIQMERENIDNSQNKEKILYDGFEFQKIISKFIPANEQSQDTLHIVLTNKLTCTFDESDFRYHARVLIGTNPSIISTTGIIEAPAKPKEYYLELMTNFSKEDTDKIKEKFKGEFLEYHDPRLSEIVEGYMLQSIMYYETGEAFCENKECRLYNAHWQKELLHSQLNKKFCSKHEESFKKLINYS
ncbi:hypothetical protein AAA799E16_00768 [Marine Group I thaumarchaeote SCGC AAA799-E16]|uniref:Uncharacterized protein n=3 Tax=Marine Group I TaxID=905826 RepID=A0A087S973_9ARCH|nr:hypothetical protein AAA799E16_00768 [Marine Group I thaumarchaeote SCGC AAA799-E16]KFM18462.1 hypothetical protein SCCGRSA3_01148 [Marine Group I thaumarchaeote SCGC RSA3]KFM22277.1 hypothetical protein AAA799B03_00027 [Marine Group I thaumarchaeote SCGC AAA799-B03]